MQGNITDWGKEVKKGLIERGWSINDLAERIGKSRTRVSGVVNGRIYSDSIASAISDLLNIEKASASMKEATRDWCMDARKAMIDLDMNTGELAEKTGYSTQYLNAIICGRCYSPPVMKVISGALGIQEYQGKQDSSKKLNYKYTDDTYTEAVDSGKITRALFLHPLGDSRQYGYGFCQWTSAGRKAGLYDLVKSRGVSIGDAKTQTEYMLSELQKSYKSVWKVLQTATSVQEASDIFLVKFEAPANVSSAVKKTRASYGEQYLKIYQNQKKEENEVSKIENAVARAEAIALDDSHGYDQVDRWGNPNYDCSGLVIRCLEEAGIPAKSSGATYTGNMPEVLPKIGFKDVAKSVDLATGSGMIRGDVLLGNGHTAFYCGNGKLVHASINEKGTVTGGKSGDQTGREICIRSYYNKPWIHVYRYTGVTASASGTVNVRNYLQKGDSGDAVKEMQKMLIGCGFSCGSSGVDGSFGGDTEKALLAFQAFYGLEQDGKYGPVSKSKLVSAYNGKTAASVPEKKNTPSYTAGHEYTLQVELKVRTGPGTNYSAKKHSQLTADGQKHDKDNDGCLDAGTVVTCQAVRNVGNDIWMKAPSGWMAAYYDGKVYIK